MPVYRYASLDEARRALWMRPGDPRIPRRARGLMAFSRRIALPHPPAGVRRFRSIEEAQADRATWVVETFAKPGAGDSSGDA